MAQLTNQEFLKRLKQIRPKYKALEPYKNMRTKIKMECDKGHIFEITPAHLLFSKSECKICAVKKRAKARRMSNDEFINRLQKIHPGYTALEPYRGITHKIKIKCNKGHVTTVNPNNLISNKTNCLICTRIKNNKKKRLSNDEFIKRLAKKHHGYMPLEKYQKLITPIKVKCDQGHVFETTPYKLLNNKNTCPKCHKRKKN